MPRAIVHVDMDAFFASVEQRDQPALQHQPVLVGRVHRGVVATCSYEARRFGIHSAMPMATALRRCPHAIVVAPRFAAYQQASRGVFAIFARYTPLVEALSIDEAFLDVTGSQQLWGSGESIARRVLTDISRELQLPASAGVAPNKFVAKLASDWHKPAGLTVVAAEEVAARLAPLPIERLLGVGEKGAAAMRAAGLRTFACVRAAPDTLLQRLSGRAAASLRHYAWGRDERPVVAEHVAKSVGSEHTFDDDVLQAEALRGPLWHHALKVASRLSAHGQYATEVHLKLKDTRFRLHTRQAQLVEGSALPDTLFALAWQLLCKAPLPAGGVRLVGLSAGGLQAGAPAPTLFVDPAQEKQKRAEQARLRIEARFGHGRLTRASALDP